MLILAIIYVVGFVGTLCCDAYFDWDTGPLMILWPLIIPVFIVAKMYYELQSLGKRHREVKRASKSIVLPKKPSSKLF